MPNRTDHLISVSPKFQICFCEIMAGSQYWAAWVERRSQCQCNMTAETCSDSWKMMAAGKYELRGQPTLLRTIGEGLTLATASLSCLYSCSRFSGEILLRKPKFVHYHLKSDPERIQALCGRAVGYYNKLNNQLPPLSAHQPNGQRHVESKSVQANNVPKIFLS